MAKRKTASSKAESVLAGGKAARPKAKVPPSKADTALALKECLTAKAKTVLMITAMSKAPSLPLLVQKVPAELRVEIFKFVLQSKYSLVNVSHLPPWKRGHLLDTSLLTVSRLISAEAEDVFYKNNIIRVESLNDPYRSRSRTRYLELAGRIVHRIAMRPRATYSIIINDEFKGFPDLKSTTISIDLDGPLPRGAPKLYLDMDAFNEESEGESRGWRMLDYGVFELVTEHAGCQARLKNFRLADAVACARKLDPSTSLMNLKERYLEASMRPDRTPKEMTRRMFAFRLASFEFWRADKAGVEIEEDGWDELSGWVTSSIMLMPIDHDMLLGQLPEETRLLDLTVNEHGEKVCMVAYIIMRWLLPPADASAYRT